MLKTLSNFTKGRENLESLLGSQNAFFNKNGIGYNPGNVTNVKKLSSFFVPAKSGFSAFNSGKKASHVTYFYCMKSVHTSVEPSGVQALKNPDPLKDVEALAVLVVAMLF